MLKRFLHILMLVMLSACSLQALAQLTLPDRVCVGTRHAYWVEGLTGSTFTWKINGQVQRSTINNLEVVWDVIGKFNLEVQEHQAKCDGEIQEGMVTVVDPPKAFAGNPVNICSGANFELSESSANNFSSLLWTSTGDGLFDDPLALHPVYTPGLSDLKAGKATLFLSANGLGNSDSCILAVDQVEVTIRIMPEIIATGTDATCFGEDGNISFDFAPVEDGIYIINYDGGQFSNVNITGNHAKIAVSAGVYNNLTIAAKGCVSDEKVSVIVNQPDQIVIAASITEIDSDPGRKGSIGLNVNGGSGTYNFRWSNGATTSEIKDLSDGTYTVWVTDENSCAIQKTIILTAPDFPPVSTDDEFIAGCFTTRGNLLENDFDPEGDPFFIDLIPVVNPQHGSLTIFTDGSFEYLSTPGYFGTDVFRYAISDGKQDPGDTARVFISTITDMDCDGVSDHTDQDTDGDAIPNVDEGGFNTDTDGDGIPNHLDIDSDNDGIPDYFEAQSGKKHQPLLNMDTDGDGLDDACDTPQGGAILIMADTDTDGVPDFLDTDSDGDFIPDYIEGHDEFADGKADYTFTGKDSDDDGLDDGFDTVNRYISSDNMTGTNAAMQDFDGDGVPDWRDDNDDNDTYPTRFEDMNADGDFSNDDLDLDGHPEYLDFGRDCDMVIPETFSPNNDHIHDYFQIYCINHYPNSRIYIFDSIGNKVYEKDHYGNLEFWGSPDLAWWNGKTDNRLVAADRGMVPSGIYYYVLRLGNGEVKKSYVLVAY